jgi:hypothetical protein
MVTYIIYIGHQENINMANYAVIIASKANTVGIASSQWGTSLIIDSAASGVTKIRHDVTFPLLT